LANPSGAQDRKSHAACDSRLSINVTGEDFPPVSTGALARCFPRGHYAVNLVGNVSVPVGT
jgi:hypothetical protein